VDTIIEIGCPLKNSPEGFYMISGPQTLTKPLVVDDYNVIVAVPRVVHIINGEAIRVYTRRRFRLRCCNHQIENWL